MNKVFLMGRLTRDPEVRYSSGEKQTAVARYSVAVDRRFKRDGDPDADFFNCTAFGKQAEFCEKYLHKGTKVVVEGRLQNDNYTNNAGEKVYSMRVITESIEFAESKRAAEAAGGSDFGGGSGFGGSDRGSDRGAADDFINIPDGIEEDLPFN
ncbi:MAG: single-stranded DNA-binding protein [Lachnospiraceae bacterium]|nr:single-stranded DNA-binding protein [Lachnospiraceae bacterium]